MASTDPWIKVTHPRPAATLRLFCIPHAGGGASTFRAWPAGLPEHIEVVAIQLPGREERLMEDTLSDVRSVVDAIVPSVEARLDLPYAVFGNSMGALIGFELLRELRRRGAPDAHAFFASAHRAPHLPDPHDPIYQLPDDAFVEEVNRRYDAVPEVARQEAELMALLLPPLRADISICDTYEYREEEPLACAIHAMGGEADGELASGDLEGWEKHTSAGARVTVFPGDHFYLQTAAEALLSSIAGDLEASVS